MSNHITFPRAILFGTGDVTIGQVRTMGVSLLGGTYDSVEHSWTVTQGEIPTYDRSGGRASSTRTQSYSARYETPDTYPDNPEVTVTWTGTFTRSGGADQTLTRTDTFTIRNTPIALPTTVLEPFPQPPFRPYTIQGVSGTHYQIRSRQEFNLSVTLTGGSYDSVEHRWDLLPTGNGGTVTSVEPNPREKSTATVVVGDGSLSGRGVSIRWSGIFTKAGNTPQTWSRSREFYVFPAVYVINGPDEIKTRDEQRYDLINPTSSSNVEWSILPESAARSLEAESDSDGDYVIVTANTIEVSDSGVVEELPFTLAATITGLTGNLIYVAQFRGKIIPDPPDIDPPAIEILGTKNVEQGQTLRPRVEIESGGTYDEVDYEWKVTPDFAGSFDDPTAKNPIFTAAHFDETDPHEGVCIHCNVTFRGTGESAYENAYRTIKTECPTFTITAHEADAPEITINGVYPVIQEGELNPTATLEKGVYDEVLRYTWSVENVDGSGIVLGTFDNINSPTPTFTANDTLENIRGKIRLAVLVRRTYTNPDNPSESTITTAIGVGEENFALLVNLLDPILNQNADEIKIVGEPIPVGGIGEFSVEITHKENIYEFSAYDELEYEWSLINERIEDAKGTLTGINTPNPTFTANAEGNQELRCKLTPVGIGRTASGRPDNKKKGTPIFLTFNIEIFDTLKIDQLEIGTWREIPEPGIQYKLDSQTLPLIAEYKTHRTNSDSWVFSTEIEDLNEETNRRTFWDNRKAGNKDTVPDPSFLTRKIKDLNFIQNRLVFLTTDSVVASFAGLHGLFWGASAQGTIPADPIDLDIGNSVAAECLTSQGPNLWILTPEQQYALYPASDAGGWSPESMRIDKMAQIEIELDLRIWSNGSLVCCGHPNNLILDLSLDIRAVQPLDISARVPDLLSRPRLTKTEKEEEGKYQWEKKTSEVIARCFLPSTNTQIALQRERPSEDYDRTKDILRTRLLITKQVRETFCWSHCSFERKETDVYEFNYEIMTITQHQENLYMLVREKDENGQFHIHLESLYLGDQDREEDCCDHRIIGEEHDEPTTYRSCIQFSAPVLFTNAYGELAPTKHTNFNVKSYTLHFRPKTDKGNDNFYFNVISTPNGRPPITTTYNNTQFGFSEEEFLDSPIPEWDNIEIPCEYDAKFFNVCIESNSKIPFEILSGEWNASISGPEQRRRRGN